MARSDSFAPETGEVALTEVRVRRKEAEPA